jgi:hypothetical protein
MQENTINKLISAIRQRKCVLFGSGTSAKEFLDGLPLPIAFAVDNDHAQWGKSVRGLGIFSPEVLKDESPDDTVIILGSSAVVKLLLNLALTDLKRVRTYL